MSDCAPKWSRRAFIRSGVVPRRGGSTLEMLATIHLTHTREVEKGPFLLLHESAKRYSLSDNQNITFNAAMMCNKRIGVRRGGGPSFRPLTSRRKSNKTPAKQYLHNHLSRKKVVHITYNMIGSRRPSESSPARRQHEARFTGRCCPGRRCPQHRSQCQPLLPA